MELIHIAKYALNHLDLMMHKKLASQTALVETKEFATRLMELAHIVKLLCYSMLMVLLALTQNALMRIKFKNKMN
jgi:hypothetical protein